MNYKFSIVDDESNKVLGYCEEVGGLKSELPNRNDDGSSKLVLHGFKLLTETFNQMPKAKLSNIHLNFLSRDGTILGGYYFSLNGGLKISQLNVSESTPIEFTGYFGEDPLPFAYEVWRKLCDNPNETGQWKNCSLEEKQAWLQVVRLRRDNRGRKDTKEKVITIDGELIQDVETFYIAIGEAINGPFGYYGAILDSFEDCLNGGFGLMPPFTLEWKNFHKSFEAKSQKHIRFVFMILNICSYRGVKVLFT